MPAYSWIDSPFSLHTHKFTLYLWAIDVCIERIKYYKYLLFQNIIFFKWWTSGLELVISNSFYKPTMFLFWMQKQLHKKAEETFFCRRLLWWHNSDRSFCQKNVLSIPEQWYRFKNNRKFGIGNTFLLVEILSFSVIICHFIQLWTKHENKRKPQMMSPQIWAQEWIYILGLSQRC